jgi:hypothetical protein
MKWCCVGFEAAYQAAGERSIAVIVDESSDSKGEFFLQARTFDIGTEPQLNLTVPMSLAIQTGLQFCPWCGVRLDKWYGRYVRELKRPEFRIDRHK